YNRLIISFLDHVRWLTPYRRRPLCGRSERLANFASTDSRRDSRGVPYKFRTVRCWWKSLTDFKKLFFLQFFPRAEQERLKREYLSIRQTSTETSTRFMQRFLRLAGFLGAAAGTEEEQAKNFQ
nr:zinc finger, CCHC-type, retrotransposon Gag domain protein [Tanacetum cinerariifolium]